jgi:hypothetical protein
VPHICLHCGRFRNKVSEQACAKCNSPFDRPPDQRKLPQGCDRWVIHFEMGGDFSPVSQALEVGEIRGRAVLQFDEAHDIPGTDFSLVCPMQSEVVRGIVDQKMTDLLGNPRSVQVAVGKDSQTGHLVLADNFHHRFVAALRAKVPVVLYLTAAGFESGLTSWKGCPYKD